MAAPPTKIEAIPYWDASASLPPFRKLNGDVDVEVAIVGGGITGLTTAYLLAAAGRSVALLERDRCAEADTGHTSAHLTMVTDASLTELTRRFGRDHAQAVWDSGLAAIAQIDDIIRTKEIDCDFAWVPGFKHAPDGRSGSGDIEAFRKEAALARELGFDATFADEVPFAGGAGIRFDDQARFHPRKYLSGLARAIRDAGGLIFERSNAEAFHRTPLSIASNGHRITCRNIVIATHYPVAGIADAEIATTLHTSLTLNSTYVVAGRAAVGVVPGALFWDTARPYRYVRLVPHRDFDLVIAGGQDHKTGQVEDTLACYGALQAELARVLPDITFTSRWSGQVIETPDGLPYIGRISDHHYAATGFSGNGLTFGTLAAMLISDQILGLPNPWTDLFDPGRPAVHRGLWDYLKQSTDYPYYKIRDRFAGDRGRLLRSVKRGQGRILERGGKPVAVYRQLDGAAIVRDAACTHMGCLVTWNTGDHTWDCPCHGSRFAPNGHVNSGPAQKPLPPPDKSD